MDLGEADTAEVVIGLPGEAVLSLGPPSVAEDGSAMYVPVRLSAEGVASSTRMDLAAWSDGPSRFVDYFEDLAASWRGWDDAKEFGDDGPNVSMSATHDRIGHVRLLVSVEPFAGWDGSGSWLLRVVVPIEPGALERIATEIRLLIEGSRG